MANPEHLTILLKGVDAWNRWREEHPENGRPDLAGANLRGANLRGANLRGANLEGANLRGANLEGANLKGVNLRGVNLRGANLRGANLEGANLKGVNLRGADLRGANLEGANLKGVNLRGADLRGANLERVNLRGADLEQTHLEGANLRGADLVDANLRGADLVDANLSMANLSMAHIEGAHLTGVDLVRTNLEGANLEEANLEETKFIDVDLSNVHGLLEVKHYGRSFIDIDTFLRSQGNIPDKFLLDAGIPADAIDYLKSLARSLAGKVISFYDCFISYSSRNQDFANRLHTDLQARNVPNWFAPEDMKIGDKIRSAIDRQIRYRDKLLLVLSEQALASGWVETEVEIALEEERRRKTAILFPIRIDAAVMDSGEAWAAEVCRRHIGDFTNWKNHDSYQQALDRLIRDLRSDAPPPPPAPQK